MESLEHYVSHANEMMDKSVRHLGEVLTKIRAGKAMPNMLDGILVEYYGNPTPVNQVASVTTPDAKTLMIKPWEKTIIPDLEKAIMNSDLGLNPQNDGEQVILNVPPLTEERRLDLVKQVKHEGEQGKVSVRNARHDALNHIKKLKDSVSEDDIKRAEDKVQKMTNDHAAKIDELINHKEKEIMTV